MNTQSLSNKFTAFATGVTVGLVAVTTAMDLNTAFSETTALALVFDVAAILSLTSTGFAIDDVRQSKATRTSYLYGNIAGYGLRAAIKTLTGH